MPPEPGQKPDLRGEQSREDDAAKEGIVARDLDPEVEVGEPDDLADGETGDADDDHDVEDRDDTGNCDGI